MKGLLKVLSYLLIVLGIAEIIVDVFMGVLVHSNAALTFLVLLAAASGIFDIISGYFGLKEAKDPSNYKGALICACIATICAVWKIGMDFNASNICAAVIPSLFFIAVHQSKKA